MNLYYKNEKLKNYCENPDYQNEVIKKYGIDVAKNIYSRIADLKDYDSLNDVPIAPPIRRHKLYGDYKDHFAINITRQYRLIFRQKDDNIIIEDLRNIKEIMITEVSKHYE